MRYHSIFITSKLAATPLLRFVVYLLDNKSHDELYNTLTSQELVDLLCSLLYDLYKQSKKWSFGLLLTVSSPECNAR